ncbi:MAG: histidine kinase [Acidobacteria bacterium]|nr:histidine kinase [Acidobacteriota bacterium]MCB9398650.1 histidine kinase [Acidobacteriota bacterium]
MKPEQHVPPLRKTFPYVAIYLCLGGLISTFTVTLDYLAGGRSFPWYLPPLWEFSGFLSVLPIYPLSHLAFQKWPLTKPNLASKIFWHILLSLFFSTLATTLFISFRVWLYKVLSFGDYQYGILIYRYLFEYSKFITFYWFCYAFLRLYQLTLDKKALQERETALREAHNRAQIQALKSQINPHFLFNTLNTISATMYEDLDKADQMISLLSDLLRRSLDLQPAVSLAEELETLNAYLAIMKARMGDRLQVQFDVDAHLTTTEVPSFILQPLVENAIQHHPALAHETVQIAIQAQPDLKGWTLSICDNGRGKVEEMGEGLGLMYVRERMATLKEPARLDFSQNPDGLTAHLHFGS